LKRNFSAKSREELLVWIEKLPSPSAVDLRRISYVESSRRWSRAAAGETPLFIGFAFVGLFSFRSGANPDE